MGPQWGVRVHKACAWVRLQIEGCRDVEFTYPTHLWQAVDFGVRQLHEHVVVGLESVRVGVGAGAPALEVGPADEAGVNVYVGQRHAAAFLKVEVQVDSAGPGDAIRAAYGPAPCAQAVPRVCAEVLRLRIAVATWFRQYTCDADSSPRSPGNRVQERALPTEARLSGSRHAHDRLVVVTGGRCARHVGLLPVVGGPSIAAGPRIGPASRGGVRCCVPTDCWTRLQTMSPFRCVVMGKC